MLDKIRKEDPKLILAMRRSGIIRKRTVRTERWFLVYRRHRWRFDTAYAFAEWYINRVHGALDLEYFETPNEAFIQKMCSENTLGMFFVWCEKEVSL
ncbi:hypothetical protein C5S39_14920 [Candidatus Methanophagaceae archaeon]|jgi:hypothetical protein|nr:hypothetical protein C5S39_14920 [Methanophagales archaeon]